MVAQSLGLAESQIRPVRMIYDLRQLRIHAFIERIPKTHRDRFTPFRPKAALFYGRAHQRLVRPRLSNLPAPHLVPSSTRAADHAKFQNALDACAAQKMAP